jgi:hypothetical protein
VASGGRVIGVHTPEFAFELHVGGRPPPGDDYRLDVDEDGNGTLEQQRLHQLVRQRDGVRDATFEITFRGPGTEAYCFTFG